MTGAGRGYLVPMDICPAVPSGPLTRPTPHSWGSGAGSVAGSAGGSSARGDLLSDEAVEGDGVDRGDVLRHDAALRVEEEGLGETGDVVLRGDHRVGVLHARVAEAVGLDVRRRTGLRVVAVDADEHDALGAPGLLDVRD